MAFKMSRTMMYTILGGLVVGVIAYLQTEPETTPHKATSTRRASQSNAKASQYTDEDYSATFPVLASAPKDAFKPLVVRTGGAGAGDKGPSNAIPADFAGGEGSWVCTGTASIDGERMALLENQGTGEGVFLKVGEHWKKAILVEITDESVTFVGPNGVSKAVSTKVPEEAPKEAPVEPANPFNGPIGRGNFNPGQFNFGGDGGFDGAISIEGG